MRFEGFGDGHGNRGLGVGVGEGGLWLGVGVGGGGAGRCGVLLCFFGGSEWRMLPVGANVVAMYGLQYLI